MQYSNRRTRPISLLPLVICALWPLAMMSACGGQDIEGQPEVIDLSGGGLDDEDVRKMGKADDIEPPKDSKIEEPEDPFVDDPDRYPMFETVRYVDQYQDCKDPICRTEMRFGLRGGTVAHYQRGTLVRNVILDDADRTKLRELIGRGSTLGEMLFSTENFPCEMIDERRVDNSVTLELSVYTGIDSLEYFEHTISHCPVNMVNELPDEFIEFIHDINRRY